MAFYTIYPKEINTFLFQKKLKIVDLREPEEFRSYHFRGAVNIPYDDEDDWVNHFSKRFSYLFYCEYGSTSLYAARKLSRIGFEVYTVIGGAKAMQEYFLSNQ